MEINQTIPPTGHDAFFKDRLKAGIRSSGYRSEAAFAKAAGMKPSQLHSIINDEKKYGPGAYQVAGMARALNISPNEMLGCGLTGRPSFEAIISSWHKSGKTLKGLSWAMDCLHCYELPNPDENRIVLKTYGKSSLAAEVTGISSRAVFQASMDLFPDRSKRRAIISEISAMADKDIDISIQKLKVPQLAGLRSAVVVEYQRLLLACSDDQGQRVVISHALRI